MTTLNDYIIITWSPCVPLFLHFSFLWLNILWPKFPTDKRQAEDVVGQGVKDHRLLFHFNISWGVWGGSDSAGEVFVFIILKIFNLSWAEVWRRNGKGSFNVGSVHTVISEIPKLLFRTVLALWDPLIIATGAFINVFLCLLTGPGEQMARDIMCCRQRHRDRVAKQKCSWIWSLVEREPLFLSVMMWEEWENVHNFILVVEV